MAEFCFLLHVFSGIFNHYCNCDTSERGRLLLRSSQPIHTWKTKETFTHTVRSEAVTSVSNIILNKNNFEREQQIFYRNGNAEKEESRNSKITDGCSSGRVTISELLSPQQENQELSSPERWPLCLTAGEPHRAQGRLNRLPADIQWFDLAAELASTA
ncbi:hypothetical protein DNTS_033205 [Danionella cerebrum]|uniref:Uncharacterized protein n=1 Tax=Danionella cerebrum TaxID=2873325 RepID=A0A553P110_9TELE|nr:hypothetical protein DNTS_033205 [Danionella translucida]